MIKQLLPKTEVSYRMSWQIANAIRSAIIWVLSNQTSRKRQMVLSQDMLILRLTAYCIDSQKLRVVLM